MRLLGRYELARRTPPDAALHQPAPKFPRSLALLLEPNELRLESLTFQLLGWGYKYRRRSLLQDLTLAVSTIVAYCSYQLILNAGQGKR